MGIGYGEEVVYGFRDLVLIRVRFFCKKGWGLGDMVFMELFVLWEMVGVEYLGLGERGVYS